MILQDFLKQNKECHMQFGFYDNDFEVENFNELPDDLRSCNEGSRPLSCLGNLMNSRILEPVPEVVQGQVLDLVHFVIKRKRTLSHCLAEGNDKSADSNMKESGQFVNS